MIGRVNENLSVALSTSINEKVGELMPNIGSYCKLLCSFFFSDLIFALNSPFISLLEKESKPTLLRKKTRQMDYFPMLLFSVK